MRKLTDSFSRSGVGLNWRVKTLLLIMSMAIVLGVLILTLGTSVLNQYQSEGQLTLDVLDQPVSVFRDELGIPYIVAADRRDMIRAQGFVIGQDRLFQLEMYRAQIWGRLSRYLGEKTIKLDTAMRVFGLTRLARKHVALLSPVARQYLQDYIDGLNAYITTRVESHPVELSLIGINPKPWTLTDVVAVLYFVNYQTGANRSSEVLSQMLIDRLGLRRAGEIFPVNVNPLLAATGQQGQASRDGVPDRDASLVPTRSLAHRVEIPGVLPAIGFGSNAWAVAPAKSATNGAVLANDPHLDARILPGIWFPMGLSFPGFRAVGCAMPAIPGLLIGRNNRVAWGMTNGYADTQDLYIEKPDPHRADHYLEGDKSLPFDRIVELIQVKDKPDIKLTIRSTRRGPVISDHGLVGDTKRIISLRWSVAERFSPDLGFDDLFFSDSARQADQAIQKIKLLTSNVVFADVDGNIGFRASGLVPIRVNRDGSRPQVVVSSDDHWNGWIPADQMPGEFNPARAWVAAANQDVRPEQYPYYYSSYFSAAYRFRRISQLLSGEQLIAVDQHREFQLDTLNLQASRIVPALLPLLVARGHDELADDLRNWDFHDGADQRGALIFQALYRQLAWEIVSDELGDNLANFYFDTRYYWLGRIDALLDTGESSWFDDIRTTRIVEMLPDVLHRAALKVTSDLKEKYGANAVWGDAHRLTFVSPLRLSGTGAATLGGGEHAMSGSNETLLRSTYRFNEDYKTRSIDSARLLIDMSESSKMVGVVPGGQSARQFHAWQKSQLRDWQSGRLNDWWLGLPPQRNGKPLRKLILQPD